MNGGILGWIISRFDDTPSMCRRGVVPFDAEPQSQDLVAELRRWGSVEVGTLIVPDNAWGPLLTKLLNDAADRIEELEGYLY